MWEFYINDLFKGDFCDHHFGGDQFKGSRMEEAGI